MQTFKWTSLHRDRKKAAIVWLSISIRLEYQSIPLEISDCSQFMLIRNMWTICLYQMSGGFRMPTLICLRIAGAFNLNWFRRDNICVSRSYADADHRMANRAMLHSPCLTDEHNSGVKLHWGRFVPSRKWKWCSNSIYIGFWLWIQLVNFPD